MTDYNSQGSTRIHNICNLSTSRNHQAMYTALSRSSSSEGTVIIQDFSPSKITSGIQGGDLRQEFRELEMLDHITSMRYECSLDSSIKGCTRNALIGAFCQLHGNYVPSHVHPCLQWNATDPYELQIQLTLLIGE